jgi:peptidoglycan/xylan/chitin deacetylase (PgdA/CDA1 family)
MARRTVGEVGLMQSVPILMYHSVGVTLSAAYGRWVVSPARFARHMALLTAQGYVPLSVSAFVAARGSMGAMPSRPVVITFDDGLSDFATGALPILARHGFPATLFVVTGYVGASAAWLQPIGEGQRPMLGWSEIDDLVAAGVEIGAHSHTHPQLDILAPATAAEEIRASKAILEDRLGRAVTSFAYPHGYASRKTRELVREAGFASACRVRHALSSDAEDAFALSRLIVTDDLDDEAFMALLNGDGLPVAPPADRIASLGWRFVRRFQGAGRPSPTKPHNQTL